MVGRIFGQVQNTNPIKKDPLQDSIYKYQKARLNGKAVSFAYQWVEKLKKEKKDSGPEYREALNDLGDALNRSGKSKEAEPILVQALEISKQALGDNHLEVANTLVNLGLVYKFLGLYPKAEPLYLQALEIRKKALGETHSDVASLFNSLGNLYSDLGNYSKAEAFYLKATEAWKKSLGIDHPILATALNNLANICLFTGNFPKAEAYYLQALGIKKKTDGETSQSVGVILNNLGTVTWQMGNLPKSISYYLQSLEVKRIVLGADDPDLAASLNNLGVLYSDFGNNGKAERYYQEALNILIKTRGKDHPEVSDALNNLGVLYSAMGKFAKAEKAHFQALNARKKVLGEHHFVVAVSLENMGNVLTKTGHFKKSEAFQMQALQIRRKALPETHPQLATSLGNLGGMHFGVGKLDLAETWYLEWNEKKQAQIRRYFPHLSDQEKERFYETLLLREEDIFKSFCVERYSKKKSIAADLYNDQLSTKGLLLSSSAKWRHRIRSSGDTAISALFTRWEASRNQLNKLLQSTDSTELAGMDSVLAKTEKLEKELSLRSENFARLADKKVVDWKEVQKALKPGEAAIEMIRVKKFGIEKTVTDTTHPKKPTYKMKGLTDTIYYAALIVKPESVYPEMVLLKNGNDLEGKYLNFYQNSISKQIQDNQSYGKFWEKIGAKLGNSLRVYFSPDGVFHHINLNTLFNPKTKKYLLEENDIRLVTSTKDLLQGEKAENPGLHASVIGFPSYYSSQATSTVSTEYRSSPKLTYRLAFSSDQTIAELPATRIEADKITGILQTKNWTVTELTGDQALEEKIKESISPKVMHMATHGFFQPDSTKGSNPLLRSGLMLTGAGSTLKGEKNETSEDGILTAYEAMNLNLDNTDLVVLSACETGLGEIKNGEGVYGLQRAFKVAGARSLIMSLWKVNDDATQELMVGFYKNWLGGTSKRAAFLKAQKELKVKYPNPYYWGAFVMVGE